MSDRPHIVDGLNHSLKVLRQLADSRESRPTDVSIKNAIKNIEVAATFLRDEHAVIARFFTVDDD